MLIYFYEREDQMNKENKLKEVPLFEAF